MYIYIYIYIYALGVINALMWPAHKGRKCKQITKRQNPRTQTKQKATISNKTKRQKGKRQKGKGRAHKREQQQGFVGAFHPKSKSLALILRTKRNDFPVGGAYAARSKK